MKIIDKIVQFLDNEGILPEELSIFIQDYVTYETDLEQIKCCVFNGNTNTITIVDFPHSVNISLMQKQNEILKEIIDTFGFAVAILLHEIGHFFFLHLNEEEMIAFSKIDFEISEQIDNCLTSEIYLSLDSEAKTKIDTAYSELYTSALNERVANRNALILFEYLKENFKYE